MALSVASGLNVINASTKRSNSVISKIRISRLVYVICVIVSFLPFPVLGRGKVAPRVIDRLTVFNQYSKQWVAEGVKLNDEPDFGGYQRIDLATYSSPTDFTSGSGKVRYQIKGLLGLKLIRAEVVVNLGFPGYGVLLEYSWTNSPATPRDYFKTVEILRIEGNMVTRVWKYNTEEDVNQEGKYVSAHLNFLSTSQDGAWDIVVNRIECSGRSLSCCKSKRLIYRYGEDGKFHLAQTDSVIFAK